MRAQSVLTATVLIMMTIAAVAATFFTADPVHEGYVTSKDFEPGHWMSTGKSMIYVDDSWTITISGCEQTTGHCGTGSYSVSHQTYDQHQIGDFMKFAKPDPFWYTIERIALGGLGLGLVWFTWWLFNQWFDDEPYSDWILDCLMLICLLLCLGIGEGLIFLGSKGPDGIFT